MCYNLLPYECIQYLVEHAVLLRLRPMRSRNPDPHQTVSNHIKLLRRYNDIRDIGTSLMGVIANNRQVPMKRVYEDFHVDEKD